MTNDRARPWTLLLLGAGVLLALYAASVYNYLLFHTLIEGFAIVVAGGVFMLAWNSRRILDNNYLLLVGIAYLFIAILDLVHTIAYKGMGVFPGYGPNLATQLWIAARYVEALTLVTAPLLLRISLRPRLALASYAAATAVILAAVFAGMFPDCFVDGRGLTEFKVGSEYAICGLLAVAAGLLYGRRAAFDRDVLYLLLASILITIVSELSFTLYADPYGFSNLVGHLLKAVSFFLIYKAVIVTGLARPYDVLYRQLGESEQKYRHLFSHMPMAFAYHELVTDPNDRPIDYIFREVNQAFEEQTGLTAESVVGKRVTEVIPGIRSMEPDLIQLYGKVALGGGAQRFEIYSPPLERYYSVVAYSPQPRHFIALFQDVSEHKRAEETLKASHAAALNMMEDAVQARQRAEEATVELRRLQEHEREIVAAQSAVDTVNAMGEGVLLFRRDGTIITANPAAEALAGLTHEELVGHDLHDVVDDLLQGQDREMALRGLDEVAAGRMPELTPVVIRRSDHAPVTVSPSVTYIETANHRRDIAVLTLKDVTELQQSIEEAILYRQRLRALSDRLTSTEEQERRRLATQLHDTVIQTLSLSNMRLGALLSALEPEDHVIETEHVAHVRRLIDKGISECRGLMGDLMPPLLYELGLEAALHDFAERQREYYDVSISVHDDGKPKPLDEGQRGLLFQAARELIVNAEKHAGPCEITVTLSRNNGYIVLNVRDNGMGFNPEAEDIFEADEEGGFGLFNIRERLRGLGGDLQIDSTPGRGTSATIRIPVDS